MPFDRLVRAVDEWAGARGRNDIFAQIGETAYRPEHIEFASQIDPDKFRELVANAEAVVAHAGTGTILTALELGTPVLVMPRHGALKETRNDHQIATAQRFKSLGRVEVAMDEKELAEKLDHLADLPARELISTDASAELIGAIRGFIWGSNPPI
ncbi:MAG: hypothetical protein KC996_01935 [Phycisphaerales bacterium]|nr:hypothetical protein [Phycisphaerales bacterium]